MAVGSQISRNCLMTKLLYFFLTGEQSRLKLPKEESPTFFLPSYYHKYKTPDVIQTNNENCRSKFSKITQYNKPNFEFVGCLIMDKAVEVTRTRPTS